MSLVKNVYRKIYLSMYELIVKILKIPQDLIYLLIPDPLVFL